MPANLSAMTWWQYVQRIAAGQTQEQIARRVDVSTPTVGRWQASTPKPESVAGFARAYGRPVLEAFLAAGFLTEEEAHAQVTIQRYEDPSDETLLQLLAERLRRDREDVTGDDQHRPPMNQGAADPALTHVNASPAQPAGTDAPAADVQAAGTTTTPGAASDTTSDLGGHQVASRPAHGADGPRTRSTRTGGRRSRG